MTYKTSDIRLPVLYHFFLKSYLKPSTITASLMLIKKFIFTVVSVARYLYFVIGKQLPRFSVFLVIYLSYLVIFLQYCCDTRWTFCADVSLRNYSLTHSQFGCFTFLKFSYVLIANKAYNRLQSWSGTSQRLMVFSGQAVHALILDWISADHQRLSITTYLTISIVWRTNWQPQM